MALAAAPRPTSPDNQFALLQSSLCQTRGQRRLLDVELIGFFARRRNRMHDLAGALLPETAKTLR